MAEYHQINDSSKVFNVNKRTDGNEKYHLLPVAISDYIVARFALLNGNLTTAHNLMSQALEKFTKLFLIIHGREIKYKHIISHFLQENNDLELFGRILSDEKYMELIGVLEHQDFIDTRYGKNYISAQFPDCLEILDRIVSDFLCNIPPRPRKKKIMMKKKFLDVFLESNNYFSNEDITVL